MFTASFDLECYTVAVPGRCGGTGRRKRLKIVRRKACGFESLHRHHSLTGSALMSAFSIVWYGVASRTFRCLCISECPVGLCRRA